MGNFSITGLNNNSQEAGSSNVTNISLPWFIAFVTTTDSNPCESCTLYSNFSIDGLNKDIQEARSSNDTKVSVPRVTAFLIIMLDGENVGRTLLNLYQTGSNKSLIDKIIRSHTD